MTTDNHLKLLRPNFSLVRIFALCVVFYIGLALSSNRAWSNSINHGNLNALAKALVRDLYSRHPLKAGEREGNFRQKRVYMARHSKLTREKLLLLRDFGIPNLFQVGTSTQRGNGTFSANQVAVNSRLIGLHIESLEPTALHPKFAVVDPHGQFDTDIPYVYGSVIIELRIDKIQDRTTYTMSDSYKRDESADPGLPLNHDSRIEEVSSSLNERGYIEAQIWGPVLPTDIKAIYVEEDLIDRFRDLFLELAEERGISIYSLPNSIQKASRVNQIANGKEKLIFRGSPVPKGVQPFRATQLIKNYLEETNPEKKSVIIDALGLFTDSTDVQVFLRSEESGLILNFCKAQYELWKEQSTFLEREYYNLWSVINNHNFNTESEKEKERNYLEAYSQELLAYKRIAEKKAAHFKRIVEEMSLGEPPPVLLEVEKELSILEDEWKTELQAPAFLSSYTPKAETLKAPNVFRTDEIQDSLKKIRRYQTQISDIRRLLKWLQRATKRRAESRAFLIHLSTQKEEFPEASRVAAQLLKLLFSSQTSCENAILNFFVNSNID